MSTPIDITGIELSDHERELIKTLTLEQKISILKLRAGMGSTVESYFIELLFSDDYLPRP